jgi:hypothetical protein
MTPRSYHSEAVILDPRRGSGHCPVQRAISFAKTSGEGRADIDGTSRPGAIPQYRKELQIRSWKVK